MRNGVGPKIGVAALFSLVTIGTECTQEDGTNSPSEGIVEHLIDARMSRYNLGAPIT